MATEAELTQIKQRVRSSFDELCNKGGSGTDKDKAELLSTVFADFKSSDDASDLSEIGIQQVDTIESHPPLKEYHDCFRHNLLCASFAFLCCSAAAGLCGSFDEFPAFLQTMSLLFREPVVVYLAQKLREKDHSLSLLRFAAMAVQQNDASLSPLQFIDQLSRELTLIQRSEIEYVAATALRAHDTMLQYKQQVSLWLVEEKGGEGLISVKSNVQIKAVVDAKQYLDNLLSKSERSSSSADLRYDNVEQMIQLALGLSGDEASINGILLCDALKQIRILETQSVISLTEITTVCDSEIDSNVGNNEKDVDEVARLMSKNRRDVCCILM